MLLQQKVQRGESKGMAPAFIGNFQRHAESKSFQK
jgi:hypothetical protein